MMEEKNHAPQAAPETDGARSEKEKRKDKKRQVKTAVVGTAVAASLLAGALFQGADDSLVTHPDQLVSPPAAVAVLEEEAPPADDQEEKRRQAQHRQGLAARVSRWFKRLPAAARLLLTLPVLAAGKGLSLLAAGAVSAAGGPLLGAAAGAAVDLAVLGGTVAAANKLLHPERPWYRLLTRKTVYRLLLAVAALALADALLPLFFEKYTAWRHLILVSSWLCLGAVVWLRAVGGRADKKARQTNTQALPAGCTAAEIGTESSICTGETLIGFREPKTGRLLNAVAVRGEKDIREFYLSYGLQPPKKPMLHGKK